MPKHPDPLTRLWHTSLLLLGCAVALSLTLQLLASIWPWIVVVAAVIVIAATLRAALRRRRDDW